MKMPDFTTKDQPDTTQYYTYYWVIIIAGQTLISFHPAPNEELKYLFNIYNLFYNFFTILF